MRLINLLLIISSIIVQHRGYAQICSNVNPPRYKNLYGFTDFNTSRGQPELFYGTMKTLDLADQARNAAQPDITPFDRSQYDFIIVGAGSAGSVMASRLSEWPRQRVLLIEAGDEEVYYMDIPLMAPTLQRNASINWNYTSKSSDRHCLSMVDRRCMIPRGRVMGGSSTLNYMMVTRGHPEDYNKWAMAGNEGWAYEDVLKYFKKLETMHIPELRRSRQHGTSGPIPVTYPSFRTPLARAFVEAGAELGYPWPDYNSGNMIGFSYLQSSTLRGSRVSGNRGYLHSKLRANLRVSKRSLVRKILINDRSRRAYGVEFIKGGKVITVFANKEVIVSAGVIGSPQLLMISGIGPANHLRSVGIRVMQNAPVGENFQDHMAYTGLLHVVDQPVSLVFSDLIKPGTPYLGDYLLYQRGPFTTLGGGEAIAYINVNNPSNLNAHPDVEYLFATVSLAADSPIIPVAGYDQEIRQLMSGVENDHMWTPLVIVLRPKSRGTVRLQSASIHDKPIIAANYFDHPDDMKTMIAGIRQGIRIGQTKAMRRFNSTRLNVDLAACKPFAKDSDQQLDCLVRHLAMSVYHPAGTCKMAPEFDHTAVVNPKLQVIGIDRLRVVDASIIPEIPTAHLNIPVYMIAEKAADIIKQTWNYPRKYLT